MGKSKVKVKDGAKVADEATDVAKVTDKTTNAVKDADDGAKTKPMSQIDKFNKKYGTNYKSKVKATDGAKVADEVADVGKVADEVADVAKSSSPDGALKIADDGLDTAKKVDNSPLSEEQAKKA